MALELPGIGGKLSINEFFVDATPDGDYALRILRAYRRRCDERWQVHGLSAAERMVYELMNECQAARASELDAAIARLMETPNGKLDRESHE